MSIKATGFRSGPEAPIFLKTANTGRVCVRVPLDGLIIIYWVRYRNLEEKTNARRQRIMLL